MFVYWLLFMVPAFAASTQSRKPAPPGLSPAWLGTSVLLISVVGLRHQVGGDWGNYFDYLVEARQLPLSKILLEPDPGYRLLNWWFSDVGWGIYGVNTVSAIIFVAGLSTLCRNQPEPWLALAVAVPYLVIVVAMGYTRQGVALGFEMLGIVAAGRGSLSRFIWYIALATTFHRSAILLLPIAALSSARNRAWTITLVAIMGVLLYYLLLSDNVEVLYENYVVAKFRSEGAFIRLLMNVIPATVFLLLKRRMSRDSQEERLLTAISVSAVGTFFLFFFVQATTALDRVALYALPLQIIVFARLPTVIFGANAADAQPNRRLLRSAIIGCYAAVQFVWLVFGTNSFSWIPYRFYLLE